MDTDTLSTLMTTNIRLEHNGRTLATLTHCGGLSPATIDETRGQCYKTFSVRDLQTFVLRQSVCQTGPEKLTNDKHSSLLRKSVTYRQKSFIAQGPGRRKCYKKSLLKIRKKFYYKSKLFLNITSASILGIENDHNLTFQIFPS